MDRDPQRITYDYGRLGYPPGTPDTSDFEEKLDALGSMMENKDIRGGCELIYQPLLSFLLMMDEAAKTKEPLTWPMEMRGTEFARLFHLLVTVAIGMDEGRGGIDSDISALALGEMPEAGEAMTVLHAMTLDQKCSDVERRAFYFRRFHPLSLKLLVYLTRMRCENG